jgi:hypothetical protein
MLRNLAKSVIYGNGLVVRFRRHPGGRPVAASFHSNDLSLAAYYYCS